ncbi:MAG: rhomboid family intramembrane serine protease [Symploca sp. SIO3C6]|uniref:Rhomboid family intramembrane serine protease n=1 Tax=Symploca sp. SIO1C4 TaxID=2607765 RepID=A0A6B3NEB3_9CYAN|nr:rhomboid family intramembrane serine protease [Symploca sp. SIO3C6]NER31816.1 rhomboid family intramembrane serine protease [Symploca sp. SIO1C4]NET08411.1 rhomboid family intramembrane serine protease [Symploca sp. SIO2B6]NET48898.1 rhomboid family intramembrane serine protease [Merismopedia sp. SIO2A8]
MFPISDDNPTRIRPYVTYALIAINIVVFLHEMSLAPPQLQAFFHLYAVVPKELTASLNGIPVNQPVPEPLTLVTSQFLHGGFMHIAGNMLFLWIFGNNVEDKLGHVKYIIFYITCGILAALAQWIFSVQSGIPSLGASGAIAGVMGAYILRFPKARIRTLIFLGYFVTSWEIPAVFFLGFWFVQQAFNSFASLAVQTDVGMETGGIAYWAHAGGFVFGAILGPLMGLLNSD